ncbi:MAG TPA: MHYT domain-containing protein [Nitrospiria bacterium]|jgi:methyl-accepting chemotaxis protein PixJ|nr:MHYT domain-containing protein [Nitrospiria bacterium]
MKSADMTVTMVGSYDMSLVFLSYVIAAVASFVALDLAGRVTASQGSARKLWLMGGAIAMGVGIWSMHFIAMLAFSLPVTVSYDTMTTAASLLAAVATSGIALFIVSRDAMGLVPLVSGSVLMGVGIGTMHYTGMAAMRLDATMWYDRTFFAASIVVAIVVSLVALWLAFHLRGETSGIGTLQKIVSALVMGAAIVGMHFTGQLATNFTPTAASMGVQGAAAASGRSGLAAAVGITTGLILCLALVSSFLNRKTDSHVPKQAGVSH